MTEARTCPRCGTALLGALLDNLCPHCVAAAAMIGANGSSQGREIGGYEIIDELGRGGMGVVYLARQRSLDRLVALKVLAGGAHAGPAAEERFLREAREAARLHHPNIVAIHEVGRHEGRPFYSMDLVEGENVDTYATRRYPTPREAANIVMKAARAVQHAHESGVLHRDLKPTNLLIDAAGEPHVMDFGLVVTIEGGDGLTLTGEVLGSPSYMAPEQLRGVATVASDVYGLGAVLYFLLTGRPPFVAAQLPELIAAVERGDPLPPRRLDPSLPQDLETIALHALARDPARRYPSAAELANDLQRWLEGRAIQARPVSTLEKAWHWARRNRTLAAMAAGLVATVCLGIAGVVSQWRRAENAAANTARTLYSSDLKVASDALLTGDLGLARSRLDACPISERDAAWGLLWPLTHGETETEIGRARWTVTHLAVSRDGKLAATTAQVDNVRLWNLVTAQPAGELPNTAFGWWAEFSPDGTQLFTAEKSVKQWDLASRRIIREFSGRSGALSPDGRTLYTCDGHRFLFEGEPGAVAAWRVSDGQLLFKLPVQARIVAVSADGRHLAVSDSREWIGLFDAGDGHVVRPAWSSIGRVGALMFSPDGAQLVASGWSAGVRVWNLANTAAPPQILRHPLSTWEAAFSSDGRVLAVACSDRQIHLWDTQTWQETRVLRGHYNEVWTVAWQPDGRLLSGGRDARVLRMRTDAPQETTPLLHDASAGAPVWLADDRLATVRRIDGVEATDISPVGRAGKSIDFAGEIPVAFDEARECLWLWASDKRELRARRATDLTDVARVPWTLLSGETLAGPPKAVPTAGRAWAALKDGSLVINRLDDGKRVGRYENVFAHPTEAMAMSPDGTRFVWGGVSTELFLLDLESGRRLTLDGHRYEVADLVFAPDGRTFLSGGADGMLIIWDARTGRRLRDLGQHATSVGRIGYSRDGNVVFTQEPGLGVHLWHPATGREVGFVAEKRSIGSEWLGLSPNGRWLGVRVSDGSIRTIPIASTTGKNP